MVSLQRIATLLKQNNSDKDKDFLFNFWQWCEAFITNDSRHFDIQTSEMGPISSDVIP